MFFILSYFNCFMQQKCFIKLRGLTRANKEERDLTFEKFKFEQATN